MTKDDRIQHGWMPADPKDRVQLGSGGKSPPNPMTTDQIKTGDRVADAERLSDILDIERYKVAIGIQKIVKAIQGRRWLSEPGRGSYAYDDERYQQEFGQALDEIEHALAPLRKIAGDWSDCPCDPLRVAANRRAAMRDEV